jgi:uncharacterized RDD family membrane protein YckC
MKNDLDKKAEKSLKIAKEFFKEKYPDDSTALRRIFDAVDAKYATGELRYANPFKRILANLIDYAFYVTLLFNTAYLLGFIQDLIVGSRTENNDTLIAIMMILLIFIFFGYLFVVEPYLLYKYGVTLGKKLTGLEVINHKSEFLNLITIKRSFARTIIKHLTSWGGIFLMINLVLVTLTDSKRALHDFAVNSAVVEYKNRGNIVHAIAAIIIMLLVNSISLLLIMNFYQY